MPGDDLFISCVGIKGFFILSVVEGGLSRYCALMGRSFVCEAVGKNADKGSTIDETGFRRRQVTTDKALKASLCYALRPRVSPFGSCLFID